MTVCHLIFSQPPLIICDLSPCYHRDVGTVATICWNKYLFETVAHQQICFHRILIWCEITNKMNFKLIISIKSVYWLLNFFWMRDITFFIFNPVLLILKICCTKIFIADPFCRENMIFTQNSEIIIPSNNNNRQLAKVTISVSRTFSSLLDLN